MAGARWTATSTVVVTLIQILQISILARLLLPRDFGLFAIVMLVLGYAQAFSDMGISNAIIHHQDTTPKQLSSLYWLNIFAGIAAFALTLALMPVAVYFFNETRLYRLVPALGLILLIIPFGQQFQLLLQKDLQFRTIAIVEICSAAVSMMISILAAVEGHGVLSIIIGRLSMALFSTIIFCVVGLRNWRPTLTLQFGEIRDYLTFGLYQLGDRNINFINARADQMLIAALIGPVALGYYSIAWNLIVMPVSRLNPVLTRVAFPLFAKVQSDKERLKRGYMMLTWLLTALNAPILVGYAATAPLLVPFLYGDKWSASILMVQLLAAVGIIRSILNPLGSLYLARGRADLGFFWIVQATILLVLCVIAGAYLDGVSGVVVGVLVAHIGHLIAHYPLLIRPLLGPCLEQYIKDILPSLVTAMAMGVVVWSLRLVLHASPNIVLAIQIGVGALIYMALNFAFQRRQIASAQNILFAGFR
jgi:O-antigen/teichoic acid export membrane protein